MAKKKLTLIKELDRIAARVKQLSYKDEVPANINFAALYSASSLIGAVADTLSKQGRGAK